MPQPLHAGFVRRAGAAILDAILVSLPGTIAHQVGLTTGSSWGDLAIESLVWLPYYTGFHASRWQATPGKHAFGIKVTDLEGRRIGVGRSFARYLASYVSALVLLIGYLMVLFTRKRQALHDLIAGTLVVDAAMEPGTLPADRQVMPLPASIVSAVVMVFCFFLLFMWVTAFMLPSPHEKDRIAEGVPAGPATGAPVALVYALYEFPYFGGMPRLVSDGTRSYRLSDVRVVAGPGINSMRVEKRLAIANGFTLAAQIERSPALQTFALQLEKDFGSSWEWFDREDAGYAFRQRQGPGRVQVRIDTVDGLEEIGEILFLEDVTLPLDRNFLMPFSAPATEYLMVKKGSLLKLSGSDSD